MGTQGPYIFFSAAVLADLLPTVCFSNDSIGAKSICSPLHHKPPLDVLKCSLSVCVCECGPGMLL